MSREVKQWIFMIIGCIVYASIAAPVVEAADPHPIIGFLIFFMGGAGVWAFADMIFRD